MKKFNYGVKVTVDGIEKSLEGIIEASTPKFAESKVIKLFKSEYGADIACQVEYVMTEAAFNKLNKSSETSDTLEPQADDLKSSVEVEPESNVEVEPESSVEVKSDEISVTEVQDSEQNPQNSSDSKFSRGFVNVKFNDTYSKILVKDLQYTSTLEASLIKDGVYLVTRVSILPSHRNDGSGSDILMLKSLYEFLEMNSPLVKVVLTDVGKFGYSTWSVLRAAAESSGFRKISRGVYEAGSSAKVDLPSKVELGSLIYQINEQ